VSKESVAPLLHLRTYGCSGGGGPASLFDQWPIVPETGPDELMVPLPGIDGGVLRATAQSFQSACNIMGTVIHTKLQQNQRPDPTEHPNDSCQNRPSASLVGVTPAPGVIVQQSAAAAGPGCLFSNCRVAQMPGKALGPSADRHPTDAQLPTRTYPSCTSLPGIICVDISFRPHHTRTPALSDKVSVRERMSPCNPLPKSLYLGGE
jgi:hypothetical protein